MSRQRYCARPDRRPFFAVPVLATVIACAAGGASDAQKTPTFTDRTAEAGFDYEHGFEVPNTDPRAIAGGVAAGDYDRDGFVDLYVERGDSGPNLLFHNLGDGTFEEVGAAAGVAVDGHKGSGPTFIDLDGDGWLDLIVGAIEGDPLLVFHNLGNGTFTELEEHDFTHVENTFSFAFGDYDRDGLADLAMSHWNPFDSECEVPCTGHLWRNEGHGSFRDVDASAALTGFETGDFSFTPNLADLDGDGWLDLLMASDFLTSQVWLNSRDGTFTNVTDRTVITDQNGMGAAVGDYDRDLDLDWFVSSIHDESGQGTGNRLYRNEGHGVFTDVTEEAGVREGGWGWGSCLADFDQDGWLDLFQTNGWPFAEFIADLSRLFLSNGDGTFREVSAAAGIDDGLQGRGVVCFDADRDGDIDLFIANSEGPPVFYRNDGPAAGNSLTVSLRSRGPNVFGAGATVLVRAGDETWLGEMRVGSNFASQQPAELHFGLGAVDELDEVEIRWPSGVVNRLRDIPANQAIEVRETYDSIGLFAHGSFALKHLNSEGEADLVFRIGPPDAGGGSTPVSGDWSGDGRDGTGIYLPERGRFILRDPDGTTTSFVWAPGDAAWLAVFGDWNGDDIDTVGLFDPVGGRFLLRDTNAPGAPDYVVNLGSGVAAQPLAGDWTGDGKDSVGLFRDGRFILLPNLEAPRQPLALDLVGAPSGALPLAGDWDGDRVDGVGYYDPLEGRFGLRSQLTTGVPDTEFAFGPAGRRRMPVAGIWN